jgi:uncharacterized protein (TIGR02246 family)
MGINQIISKLNLCIWIALSISFTAISLHQAGTTSKINVNRVASITKRPYDAKMSTIKYMQLSVSDEIMAMNRKMEKAFNEGRYSEIANYYSLDAVMVGNSTEVIGRENLQKYWSKLEGGESWELKNTEIRELSDNYALQRGISIITWKNNENKLMESKVIFSLLWKKTSEGWKIMLDHYSMP